MSDVTDKIDELYKEEEIYYNSSFYDELIDIFIFTINEKGKETDMCYDYRCRAIEIGVDYLKQLLSNYVLDKLNLGKNFYEKVFSLFDGFSPEELVNYLKESMWEEMLLKDNKVFMWSPVFEDDEE